MNKLDIIIVDDDEVFGKILKKILKNELDISSEYITSVKEAMIEIEKKNPKLALIDISFDNDPKYKNGLDIIEKLTPLVDTDFIVITGGGSKEDVFRAGQLAVKGLYEKSSNYKPLLKMIKNTLLKKKNRKYPDFVGVSESFIKLKKQIEIAAMSDMPVLITGETGVGKDIVARLIHLKGNRKNAPFRTFDAGAVDPALVGRELFGNKKGAFTGADIEYKGLFKEADKGHLFIDEIGNMSLKIQKYMLRALNSPQKIRPIGSVEEFNVDVRIILATNSDLKEYVKENKFRLDLYSRINNPLSIYIKPLRERREDIKVLFEFFTEVRKNNDRPIPNFTKKALDFLINIYTWPMNIREVDQFIGGMGEKYSGNEEISLNIVMENLMTIKSENFNNETFKSEDRYNNNENYNNIIEEDRSLKDVKLSIERLYLKKMLEKYNYNTEKVANILKITRTHLYRLIKLHNLAK